MEFAVAIWARYFIVGDRPLPPAEILSELKTSARYLDPSAVTPNSFLLNAADQPIASAWFSPWDDARLKAEAAGFARVVEAGRAPRKREVVDVLLRARGLVMVQLLHDRLGVEMTWDALHPLWRALLSSRPGALHFDELGFWDGKVVVDELDYLPPRP